jgi:hypothetical protein
VLGTGGNAGLTESMKPRTTLVSEGTSGALVLKNVAKSLRSKVDTSSAVRFAGLKLLSTNCARHCGV